jgi:MFS family permease
MHERAGRVDPIIPAMPSHRRALLGLAIVCLGALLSPLDTTVNTAFPVITAAFSLALADIQWVVIPYVLSQAIFAIVFGHLGDRFGHRRIFALGLVACALAHAAVALAPSYGVLVTMRVFQGAAVGMTVACAPALATLLFPPAGKALALARYAAAFNLAMALGPWIGGLLLGAFDWPGVFWFRVPIALVVLALVPLLPRVAAAPVTDPAGAAARGVDGHGFDWGGTLAMAAVLVCLTAALVVLTDPQASAWLGLSLLALGIAGGLGFHRLESRSPRPVLRTAHFRSARFAGIQAASVAISCACFANLLLLPYVLTGRVGASIGLTGLLLSTYPGGSVLGAALAGRLARRWSHDRQMLAGTCVAAAGLLATALALQAAPPASLVLLLTLGMSACGLGQGLFQVGYMDATTDLLPIEERGTAGSLVNVTRLLGLVLGATGIGWMRWATGSDAASFWILGGGVAAMGVVVAIRARTQSDH